MNQASNPVDNGAGTTAPFAQASTQQSILAPADQYQSRRDFAAYVASILDAAAAGKPLELRSLEGVRSRWETFDASAEQHIGFNFRHFEYRLAKEKRTVTFRLALMHNEGCAAYVAAIEPGRVELFVRRPDFIQWLGEEQTIEYEVEP